MSRLGWPLPSEDPISYDHVIRTSSNSDSEHHTYMHNEKAFATRKTVGIQVADLLARETMKLMDNEYGPVQRPMRGSYRAIRKHPKIRVRQFKSRDSNGRFDGPPDSISKHCPLMVRQVITSHIPHQRAPHGGSEPPDHRNRLKWVPSAWFPLLRASALGDKRTQRIPDDDAARGRRFSSSHDGYGCDFRTSPMTSPQTENASCSPPPPASHPHR